MKSSRVLFVSIYYNREDCVECSVESMLNQTYDNIDIILWDDGSTDETYRRLKRFESERVHVLRSAKNQGITACLREAIDSSDSDYIAIHGSGDISLPTRLERQVALLDERPSVGICGCQVEFASEAIGVSSVSRRNCFQFLDPLLCPVTHGEVMYRRDLYEKVGGYRPFFAMSQDYDLWLRFRDEHVGFEGITEVLYQTVSRKEGVSGDFRKRYIQSHYAQMAYQCWSERQRCEVDYVDSYGSGAWVFMNLSKLFVSRMESVCRLSIRAKDFDFTRLVARKALSGGFSVRMSIIWLAACVDSILGYYCILSIFERILNWRRCIRGKMKKYV